MDDIQFFSEQLTRVLNASIVHVFPDFFHRKSQTSQITYDIQTPQIIKRIEPVIIFSAFWSQKSQLLIIAERIRSDVV